MDKNLGLGKGLSALMGEDDNIVLSQPVSVHTPDETHHILLVRIDSLVPSPYQPRRVFNEDDLNDLVSSIREKGVLQPLLVRKNPRKSDGYEIIAGERRFRASKKAGLDKIPVIVKDFNDKAALEVALIENLQREDLNPLEEAEAYRRLLKDFHYTQEELSKVIGKSRSHLANQIRLLDLPDSIKKLVEEKQLTAGHARALLTAEDPENLAHQIISKGLSVRETEKRASHSSVYKAVRKKAKEMQEPSQQDKDIIALESELTQMLKTPVVIKWNGKGGSVLISYNTLDKLDIILQRLTSGGLVEE